MAHLIKLPSVAADADVGTLHQWLKQEGDTVAVGEALAEIETEKAIVEINAEQAGVLSRIVVQAGPASVPINTVIGVLLAPGEDASAIEKALAEHGAGAAASAAAATAAATSAASATAPASALAPSATAGAAAPASPDAAIAPGTRRFASPLARRLAAQWHVNLLEVQGTGPRGRIVRRDVEAARDRAPVAAAPQASRAAGRRVPHSGMRRAIARRLTESKQQVPHFYLTVDCRMVALLALRAQANQGG
ncbi:E3 binding domain-containing protein, partial [Achromobacter insuavis]|uniref:E3 binding domain-containing protein n=1 Tax=Achromobacter insuavis TaxID=1287735 RepID=UPI0035A1C4D4